MNLYITCLALLHVITIGYAIGSFENLLGPSLLAWNNDSSITTVDTNQALHRADVVGIYFSGSWCQPCKRFTPLLVTFYQRMKQKNKRFEIILVSYDKTEEDFLKYYRLMPWLSLTLENIPLYGNEMSELFKIEGIPSLVLLEGSDMSVITLDGTSKVATDTYGVEFPWRSRKLVSFVPKPVKAFVRRNYDAMSAQWSRITPAAALRLAIRLPSVAILRVLGVLRAALGALSRMVFIR